MFSKKIDARFHFFLDNEKQLSNIFHNTLLNRKREEKDNETIFKVAKEIEIALSKYILEGYWKNSNITIKNNHTKFRE